MESIMELKLLDMLPRGRWGELAPLLPPPKGRPPLLPPLERVGVTISLTTGGGGPEDDGRLGRLAAESTAWRLSLGPLVSSHCWRGEAVRGSHLGSTRSKGLVTQPAPERWRVRPIPDICGLMRLKCSGGTIAAEKNENTGRACFNKKGITGTKKVPFHRFKC